MALTSSNIQIKPMRVTFGEDRAQVFQVACGADVSLSLQNDYFFLFDGAGTRFHAWFNVNSAGVNPAPAGSTGIEVAIATNATATAVATALAAAIDAVATFVSTSSGSVVTVTNTVAAVARAPFRGVGVTDFVWKVTITGSVAAEVGYTSGEITVTTGEEVADITAHQLGTTVMGGFITGRSMEVALALEETSVAQLRNMFRAGGGDSTSGQGASGTEVFGYGTDKLFSNTFTQSQRLVLHPVANVSGNLTEDVTFWHAYPMIEDLTFSGEEMFTLPVTFKIYPDQTRVGAAAYMVIGDSTQTFTL